MLDTESVNDPRARRLFLGVFICETLVIVALWTFERFFS